MTKHFQKELDKIKKMILSLGTMVEDRMRLIVQAVETKDTEIAQRVINTDFEIDEMEVEVEEECLKALALYQPVAVDLRFLTAVVKINNDLERIADEAVNISERVVSIVGKETAGFFFDYTAMAETVEGMLKMSLDALVNLDLDLAYKVIAMDDAVDDMHRVAYDRIKNEMLEDAQKFGTLINIYLISRHLERIGDHATNIAEEVVYLLEGEIIRHGRNE